MKLIDFFDHGAFLFPDRVCLCHDDDTNSFTYSEVKGLTHRIGNGLLKSGVSAESTFAVYSPNHSLAFISILGALRIGAKWVNLNTRSPLQETIDILKLNECDFLFYHSVLGKDLEILIRELPDLKGMVCIDSVSSEHPALLEWSSRFDSTTPDLMMSDEDIGAYFQTGGTTGRPKAALLSNRSMTTMVAAFLTYMQFESSPVHLVVAPITHAAGALMFPLLTTGATHVVSTDTKPQSILQNIENYKVNVLLLPPTLIYMLLAQPDVNDYDYSSLQYFIYVAAPMAADKLEEAIRVFGPVMMQTYGQVEAPMILTCMRPEEHLEALKSPEKKKRLKSCGRPTAFTTVKIMDAHGNQLPAGERGEVVCRGSLVMHGYYKNEAETESIGKFGWHHTGDIGYYDEDGYLYLVDRKKDMIISGGYNVFPVEVESILLSHPAIQDCAVIGVPDDKWGEAVKAVVELKPDHDIDENEIIDLCKQKLGSVKAPKTIDIWDQLPRSAVGKVLKRAIRDAYWKDRQHAI